MLFALLHRYTLTFLNSSVYLLDYFRMQCSSGVKGKDNPLVITSVDSVTSFCSKECKS
jgi:hypothetical protein